MGYRELKERGQAAALNIGESAPFQAHLAEETPENRLDRCLGCPSELGTGQMLIRVCVKVGTENCEVWRSELGTERIGDRSDVDQSLRESRYREL
jgi:hypothetical protein